MNKFIAVCILSILLTSFGNIFAYEQKDILEPNESIGRYSPVFANTVIIRFSPETNDYERYYILQKYKLEIERPILKKSVLLANNPKKLKMLQSNPSINMSEVYRTEEVLRRTLIVNFEGNDSPEKICKELQSEHGIEIAETYRLQHLLGYHPNDPLINKQTGLGDVQAYEAWEIEKGNPDIIIGISDSGILQDHEDLKDAIAINKNEIPNNGIDDDHNGYIDDYNGYNFNHPVDGQGWGNTDPNNSHGTEVAGIASASTDNDIGIAGFGFNTSIYPIMTTTSSQSGVFVAYGYESIIYAAERGFKVLNLSWGVPSSYSDYEQSVIDYAIANDVSLVASTGNLMHQESDIAIYYPAGYRGVFGVGQTSAGVVRFGNSALGSSCDIHAPSKLYTTTSNSNNSYTSLNIEGTSFASPVVAAAVALVRSHFPELSAMQATELVRIYADDISDKNEYSEFKNLITGRVNLYKPLTSEPYALPAIRPIEIQYFDKVGNPRETFKVNEEMTIKIKAKNYLGAAKNLRFVLSLGYTPRGFDCFEYIQKEVSVVSVEENSDFVIDAFKIKPVELAQEKVVMRVDIYGENDYHDFFKFDLVPTPNYVTFANNAVRFSMQHDGSVGFYSNNKDEPLGAGITFKGYGNQIYDNGSGLVICSDYKKVGYAGHSTYRFQTVQKFGEGESDSICIVESPVGNDINNAGLQIKQKVGFVSQDAKSFYIDLEATTLREVTAPAMGYFLDFDIRGTARSNYSYYFDNAFDEEEKLYAAGQVAVNTLYDDAQLIAVGSISDIKKNTLAPAAAGYSWSGVLGDNGYNNTVIIKSLTSGTTEQIDAPTDIATVIGMAYPGKHPKDTKLNCRICVVAGANEDELKIELRNCLGLKNSSVIDDVAKTVELFPNPASDFVYIPEEFIISDIEIYDILGERIYCDFDSNSIDTSNLSQGIYFLLIRTQDEIYTSKISIMK